MPLLASLAGPSTDRRGFAPPVMGRCAAMEGPRLEPMAQPLPRRLHRTRRKNRTTPPGAVYVGRPTIWGNPFERRTRISHARGVILYKAWLAGDCSHRVLNAAGFSRAEAEQLARWRQRLLDQLARLAGKDLQCWCPLTSPWCHADVLLRVANSADNERYAARA